MRARAEDTGVPRNQVLTTFGIGQHLRAHSTAHTPLRQTAIAQMAHLAPALNLAGITRLLLMVLQTRHYARTRCLPDCPLCAAERHCLDAACRKHLHGSSGCCLDGSMAIHDGRKEIHLRSLQSSRLSDPICLWCLIGAVCWGGSAASPVELAPVLTSSTQVSSGAPPARASGAPRRGRPAAGWTPSTPAPR